LAEDKAYEGELELGFTTTTLDVEGEVTGRADPSGVTAEGLRAAMAAWVGDREQIPPMVSALKHGGRRLYELAREGKEVERAPRAIRLDHFELLSFDAPRGRFRVGCSKGTYVRSLVRDVGEALGCGATLTALRRTQAGRFGLDVAVPLGEVRKGAVTLVDPATAIGHLPEVRLDAAGVHLVVCGKPMDAPSGWPAGQLMRLLGPGGALVGVAEVKVEGPIPEGRRRLRSLRVFNYGLTSP
jgi:tRNA pseudouridine55 synthase